MFAIIGTIAFAVVIILSILIIIGLPLGELTMGGQYKVFPKKLRPVLVLRTSKNSPICTVLPLTTKRLQDGFWFHIDLEEIDSTVLVEQLKVVSKIRITNPYRKKGNLIAISLNDWNRINSQLENLYRLRPLKNE